MKERISFGMTAPLPGKSVGELVDFLAPLYKKAQQAENLLGRELHTENFYFVYSKT